MNTIKSIKDTLKEIILGNDYVCDTFLHTEGVDDVFGVTVFDYIKDFNHSRTESGTTTTIEYDVEERPSYMDESVFTVYVSIKMHHDLVYRKDSKKNNLDNITETIVKDIKEKFETARIYNKMGSDAWDANRLLCFEVSK